jgi:hypothetical protein
MPPHHLLLTQGLPVDSHRTLALINPIANATLCLSAILTDMWMWSGIRCPSACSIPRCWHTSLATSPTLFFSFPYSILFQYLRMMTVWYLRSHRTSDRPCQSCIGFSSLSFHGTFPEKEPILLCPGSGRDRNKARANLDEELPICTLSICTAGS